MDCVFCKISNGTIPSKKLFEDSKFFIIQDIAPKAKIHLLAIPKNHFAGFFDMTDNDKNIVGHILATIGKLEKTLGLISGYRIIINQGKDGGQTVFHLHMHILAGQELPFNSYN